MRNSIIEGMFSIIHWRDEECAYIECPGKSCHSGKSAKRDCRVTLDGAPTVFCLHTSCETIIKEVNLKMRRAIAKNNPMPKREFTAEERLERSIRLQEKKKEEALMRKARTIKDVLLKDQKWCAADAFHESPLISNDPIDDSKLFIAKMFKPDDVIWNGSVTDTGREKNKDNFKNAEQWLKDGVVGNFTSGSTFKPGTISRSNDSVLERKYLVVESDTLNQDQICCIFKWLTLFLNMKAIVYTGGKSLHAWYDFPSTDLYQRLKTMLPAMECDPALFKPSQPVRMPGVMRGDKLQCLYWLSE